MTTNVATQSGVLERDLLTMINDFKEFDEADIVTAFRDKQGSFTVQSTVVILDHPSSMPGTAITKTGKMSVFGGPDDHGVTAAEGLALFGPADVAANPDLFLPTQPPGTTGVARRLNPQAKYLACRWDYSATPKDFLRGIKVRVSNPANGRSEEARPADFGPNEATGRVADLSPGLAQALGLDTDHVCQVDIPPPHIGVAVGVDLAAIDKVVFPPDMVRTLVAMVTVNQGTYWVTGQSSIVESGQTLMRRLGNAAPEILLSNTTVFPVQVTDQVPLIVAEQLNKAIFNEQSAPGAQADAPPGPGADINAKVFSKAKEFVGHDTSNVPGTENGNLACAWSVNEVVRLALGKPISADGHGHNGLGTDGIFAVLQKHHTQVTTPVPGAIIISPTPPNGSVHGHVGIVGQSPSGSFDNTQIFSNSSSLRRFAQNRTIKSWMQRYSTELHLQVLFFELNGDQFTS